ncbi:MAG: DMT family transporter [Thermoplasmata archaeon]
MAALVPVRCRRGDPRPRDPRVPRTPRTTAVHRRGLGSAPRPGGLSSLLGYVVYFRLHHQIGPGRANLVTYLLPLVGIGLGSGLYGEAITVWEVGGFLLVVTGLSLVFLTGNRNRPAVARSSEKEELTAPRPDEGRVRVG